MDSSDFGVRDTVAVCDSTSKGSQGVGNLGCAEKKKKKRHSTVSYRIMLCARGTEWRDASQYTSVILAHSRPQSVPNGWCAAMFPRPSARGLRKLFTCTGEKNVKILYGNCSYQIEDDLLRESRPCLAMLGGSWWGTWGVKGALRVRVQYGIEIVIWNILHNITMVMT
ncbi:unnamed protein product [Tuber aestivum]|uniref:Uncharacterized protein n=1 Tax=Tuber aestivum TaxID=59557 RepID=A0A292PM59_9PEZI|nr:unnamed protein product [Tuber aestivum]